MKKSILVIDAPDERFGGERFISLIAPSFPQLDFRSISERDGSGPGVAQAEAIFGFAHHFTEGMLTAAGSLKWIQTFTTGVDAVLKLKALGKDVLLTSLRGVHGPQMSELTFLHMLALCRNYPRILDNQRNRVWERNAIPTLSGKTIVIFGVGAIASALAKRCKAFDMTVVGISSSPRPVPDFDRMMARSELNAAAALADFFVVLAPLSPQTQGIIDASVLAAMKPTAYLINVARGGVCNEDDIMAAVRDKHIAGAGLDVFGATPLPADSPLWDVPGILLTPHIGGLSTTYMEQSVPIVSRNLTCLVENRLADLANLISH
ncbi:MAG: D-2-hydroxyacid dehydrogenase [Betaproteobacteria bacterium]|nr:D-2-hydroxyacid dehydrogenase [Betaproteobacteria bacterium]